MAVSDPDTGFGSTLTGLTPEITGYLRNISGGPSRGSANTTHSSSTNGWATFLPTDVKDPGEFTAELVHDNGVDFKNVMEDVAATVTLTLPNNAVGAETYACSAFLTSYEISITAAPEDDTITANVTIKLSGVPVLTIAA